MVAEPASHAVVTLTTMAQSQALLRAKDATTQAGFTAERIPARFFRRRPILMDDGAGHQEHRRQLVRFFSPRALEQHRGFIGQAATDLVDAHAAGSP